MGIYCPSNIQKLVFFMASDLWCKSEFVVFGFTLYAPDAPIYVENRASTLATQTWRTCFEQLAFIRQRRFFARNYKIDITGHDSFVGKHGNRK